MLRAPSSHAGDDESAVLQTSSVATAEGGLPTNPTGLAASSTPASYPFCLNPASRWLPYSPLPSSRTRRSCIGLGRCLWAVDQPADEPGRVKPALAAAGELERPDVLPEPKEVADDAAELPD